MDRALRAEAAAVAERPQTEATRDTNRHCARLGIPHRAKTGAVWNRTGTIPGGSPSRRPRPDTATPSRRPTHQAGPPPARRWSRAPVEPGAGG
ncbi:hypothetical protein ABH941_005965 [Streptacidiphilus sp. EB103A]